MKSPKEKVLKINQSLMNRAIFFFMAFIFFFNISKIHGQGETDTLLKGKFPEITITSFKDSPITKTSLNISSIKVDDLKSIGAYNLAEIISKTPGISMLSLSYLSKKNIS